MLHLSAPKHRHSLAVDHSFKGVRFFPQELANTKDRSKINIGLRIIWYAVVVHVHLLRDFMGGAEEV